MWMLPTFNSVKAAETAGIWILLSQSATAYPTTRQPLRDH